MADTGAVSEPAENQAVKKPEGSSQINPKKRQGSPKKDDQETPSKVQKIIPASYPESEKKIETTQQITEKLPLKEVVSDAACPLETEKKFKDITVTRKRPAEGETHDASFKRPKRERENSDASYDDTDDNDGKKRLRGRKKYTLKCILQQMEFYFSNSNLGKDRYLKQMIDTTNDGYIDLSVFEKFNKLQSLHKDGVGRKLLLQALKGSSILEVNKEETKVRRTTPIKILTQEEVDVRTVYVENLPAHATHNWLQTIFSKCGKVNYISLPCYKTSKEIKGFAFIEFETPEEATKACTMLNNPENLEEKPGKFPKWNNTLYRLQRFVPIQMETDTNEENASTDKKDKERQEDADTEAEGKKKKKKKPSKRKSNEGIQIEDRSTTNPTEVETAGSENVCSSKDPSDTKKKKKKRKKKSSQSKDEVTAVAFTEDASSSAHKTEAAKTRKKDSKNLDQNKEGVEKHTSGDESKADNEGSKKKRKKKKKKKGEPKTTIAGDKETETKDSKDEKKPEDLTQIKVVSQNRTDEQQTSETHTDKSNETSTEKAPEQRLSAKERKRLRQADIRRKKELALSLGQDTAKPNSKDVDTKREDAEVAQQLLGNTADKSESEVGEFNAGRRKSDGSELTSILKSKKAAERKRVEFDPVPITTEFEKTKEIRKRKKVKRDKLHLRVITKLEWSSLKAEYIARQKSHMAALKESLRELRQQENQGKPAKAHDFVDLRDVFKTKPMQPAGEGLKFTPNVVVQWKCAHEMHRDKIRTMFKEISGNKIAYIDAPEEARTGYIRFKDEPSAEEFAKLSMGSEIFSARMLPADQQQAYWDKANEDRMKKLKSKKNEQGRDKLARKVFERNKATFYNKPSRIVFNDDDNDGGGDGDVNTNGTSTTENKEESAKEVDKKEDITISDT